MKGNVNIDGKVLLIILQATLHYMYNHVGIRKLLLPLVTLGRYYGNDKTHFFKNKNDQRTTMAEARTLRGI
jgi:hypothetical protein